MHTDRREFLRLAGASSAGMLALGALTDRAASAAPSKGVAQSAADAPFVTELFLDNEMIEVTPGVTRRLHPPLKHRLNPVARCERWCDGNILQPYTTMYDEDDKLFKMWARTGSDSSAKYLDGHAAYMTYLTSKDGVHWDKPDLGVTEVAGRRDHNIIFTSDTVAANRAAAIGSKGSFVAPTQPMRPQGKKAFFWGVNKHPHPRNADEKYVALAIVQDHRRGAHIVTSPDGIHWSCAAAPFWQTPNDVSGKGDDCLMHLMYDDAKQKWVIYRRIIPEFSERMIATEADADRPAVDRYYRSYAYAESDDLEEWTNHRFILSMDPDDPPDTELYQFGCHRIGSAYVGYMSVFYLRGLQPINIHLATSRDGLNFTRVCRGEPFIAHGEPTYYDYMAMACSQPRPIIVGETVFIYYAALNFGHTDEESRLNAGPLACGAALATFPRDRFASLESSELDPGPCRVITKPFTVRHPLLFLNASTWQQGSIRVEALTPDWRPIEGFAEPEARSIQGSALNHPVGWNNRADLGQLLGEEIRLKFYLTRARIHAMTLSREPRALGIVEEQPGQAKRSDTVPTIN